MEILDFQRIISSDKQQDVNVALAALLGNVVEHSETAAVPAARLGPHEVTQAVDVMFMSCGRPPCAHMQCGPGFTC